MILMRIKVKWNSSLQEIHHFKGEKMDVETLRQLISWFSISERFVSSKKMLMGYLASEKAGTIAQWAVIYIPWKV